MGIITSSEKRDYDYILPCHPREVAPWGLTRQGSQMLNFTRVLSHSDTSAKRKNYTPFLAACITCLKTVPSQLPKRGCTEQCQVAKSSFTARGFSPTPADNAPACGSSLTHSWVMHAWIICQNVEIKPFLWLCSSEMVTHKFLESHENTPQGQNNCWWFSQKSDSKG